MSAERGAQKLVACVLLGAGGLVFAADAGEPDLEFLEYLGLWEETDEEWVMIDNRIAAESDERTDPAPQGEESAETDDER